MILFKTLAKWYIQNKRELPWRKTLSPYKIWLSEIILQQTRVEQGLKYYNNFVEKYPNVEKLSDAPLDEVLKLWQGLGYYSRARNLHETAKKISEEFMGVFPSSYKELVKLKGIGSYTAAAISSICYNEPVAVVDGNVYRFLSRYFGIDVPIDKGGKKVFQKLAGSVLDRDNPGNHNQSVMEFGALQCIPVNPDCNLCPLQNSCKAYINSLVKELPAKKAKARIKERYFNYLVISCGENIFIRQRTENDIWKMLYEFPLIEKQKQENEPEITGSEEWNEIFINEKIKILNISKIFKHILTHQIIFTRFFRIEIEEPSEFLTANFKTIIIENIYRYAVPKLIEKYLVEVLK